MERAWINFVELHGFRDDWLRLKLKDEDLWAIQTLIGADPTSAPVISGTGGLRKLRFAPPAASGRRRWFRMCYVFFPEASVVVLVVAYAKNEQDDLSAADKKFFRQMIERQRAAFAGKSGPRQ
jgi:hypothetical protein